MNPTERIYVSTGGFRGKTPYEAILQFEEMNVRHFELSAGSYNENSLKMLKSLSRTGHKFKLHNYFPPPKEPFVLNLASCSDAICATSIAHCKTAIDWCVELKSNVYGLHAGYLIDPKVSELGQRIAHKEINSRQIAIPRFLNALADVASYAKARNVKLLVENNVLSAQNYESFSNQNPLLMVDPDESQLIASQFPENCFFLLDVAHLKVSANTLGFDLSSFYKKMEKYTRAYHLSENNGLEDSNEPIKSESEFFKFLSISDEIIYYSLEIYNQSLETLKDQVEIFRAWHSRKSLEKKKKIQ